MSQVHRYSNRTKSVHPHNPPGGHVLCRVQDIPTSRRPGRATLVQPEGEVVQSRAEDAATALEAHAQGYDLPQLAIIIHTNLTKFKKKWSAIHVLKLQVALNCTVLSGGSWRTRCSRSGAGSTLASVTSRPTTRYRMSTPTNKQIRVTIIIFNIRSGIKLSYLKHLDISYSCCT